MIDVLEQFCFCCSRSLGGAALRHCDQTSIFVSGFSRRGYRLYGHSNSETALAGRTKAVLLLVLPCLIAAGCGYHTASHAVTIPENVQTIAIPAFVDQTQTYRIEQLLTAAVVQEMSTRTHYRVVSGGDADATLHGTVLSTSTTPLTYDSHTGRATSALVVISMQVSLVDRQGKVLYQNPSYLFREQYEVSRDLTNFFEEDSPAFRRLSRDFAQTLVSNILEGF